MKVRLVISVVMLLVISGCATLTKDQIYTRKIIGSWIISSESPDNYALPKRLVFLKNGTRKAYIYANATCSKVVGHVNFTWKIDNGILTSKITYDPVPNLVGKVIKLRIVSISKNHMVLRSMDGRITYSRTRSTGCLALPSPVAKKSLRGAGVSSNWYASLALFNYVNRTGKSCQAPVVESLLDKGASPDASTATATQKSWGFSVLNVAAASGGNACALELIRHGANVSNARHDALGTSAIWYAVTANHCDPSLVEALIAHGANVDSRKGGPTLQLTALESAASSHNLRCARVLIEHGAKVNAADARHTNSALMWAVTTAYADGHKALPMMKLLLEHGADPNTVGLKGVTALFLASATGKGSEPCSACVRLLLQAGANPNAQDNAGDTPLLWALNPKLETTPKIIEELIDGGARVSLANRKTGETPLMAAAAQDSNAIVDLLLKNGADRCALDKSKHSASTYARKNGHYRLAQTIACQDK